MGQRTRSPHGTYLMNDIAAKHEAKLFESRFEGTFELSWKRQERNEQRAALRNEIHTWALARGGATPLEIYLEFTPRNFGKWRIHDYNECLRELVALGGINRKNAKGLKDREKLRFTPIAQVSLFDTASPAR
jgi:hypothetical protein